MLIRLLRYVLKYEVVDGVQQQYAILPGSMKVPKAGIKSSSYVAPVGEKLVLADGGRPMTQADAQSQQWIRAFFVGEELTKDYVIGAGANKKELRHIEEVHISVSPLKAIVAGEIDFEHARTEATNGPIRLVVLLREAVEAPTLADAQKLPIKIKIAEDKVGMWLLLLERGGAGA